MCVRGVRGASVCGVCVYVCVCMCVCVCVCVCLCVCVRTEVVILRMLVYPFGFEQLPAREKVFVNICVTSKKKNVKLLFASLTPSSLLSCVPTWGSVVSRVWTVNISNTYVINSDVSFFAKQHAHGQTARITHSCSVRDSPPDKLEVSLSVRAPR